MDARILVVEDDHAIRELVTGLLRDVGYHVVAARDGAAGLELLRQTTFDLAVLDMGLPILSGRELAQRMASEQIQVPVLVMTAGRDARRAAHEIGAVGYITKPFDIDELERVVRNALDGHVMPRLPYLSSTLSRRQGIARTRTQADGD